MKLSAYHETHDLEVTLTIQNAGYVTFTIPRNKTSVPIQVSMGGNRWEGQIDLVRVTPKTEDDPVDRALVMRIPEARTMEAVLKVEGAHVEERPATPVISPVAAEKVHALVKDGLPPGAKGEDETAAKAAGPMFGKKPENVEVKLADQVQAEDQLSVDAEASDG
jgi:hypothetical protein